MSKTVPVTVKDSATVAPANPDAVVKGLSGLMPGLGRAAGDPVSVPVPSYRVRSNEGDWEGLISDQDPAVRAKRSGLLEHIRAILELDAYAKKNGLSLRDAAKDRAKVYKQTLQGAWKSLLSQNKSKEKAVRWAALTLSNMQSSKSRFRNKMFAINASAREIASDTGRKFLANELSRYVNRPDPRQSRAFLLVHDWVGNKTNLHKLARVTDEHRCILVTDAPSYKDLDDLREAASEGGLLESFAGEETFHRHTILIGGRGRVRQRFVGECVEEEEDVCVPLSGPWFGMYLDNIARGMPWKPAVGYGNPVAGVDGVELDLLLQDHDQFDLFLRHRINPGILLSDGSDQVVVYGPDTLSKSGEGVQIGVGVVEMLMIRYAEWVVNQYGLLTDLEEAEDVVRKKLTQFLVLNSGAERMFRAGSRVMVSVEEATRTLVIEFSLHFREVAERAVIRLSKPVTKEKVGKVTAESSQS